MNEKLQAVTANQEKVARKRKGSAPSLPDPLRNFNGLPDEAFVRLPVVLMLLGVYPARPSGVCANLALYLLRKSWAAESRFGAFGICEKF